MGESEDVLVASSNAGRYQVGKDGPDLTTGCRCQVWLGGRWHFGTVWHSKRRGATDGLMAVERPAGVATGYYLLLDDGSVCGLCTGMLVRLQYY
jgi:hypothetical protein